MDRISNFETTERVKTVAYIQTRSLSGIGSLRLKQGEHDQFQLVTQDPILDGEIYFKQTILDGLKTYKEEIEAMTDQEFLDHTKKWTERGDSSNDYKLKHSPDVPGKGVASSNDGGSDIYAQRRCALDILKEFAALIDDHNIDNLEKIWHIMVRWNGHGRANEIINIVQAIREGYAYDMTIEGIQK